MILYYRTYSSWQTVQTQIRLLLEEQSDQGLHSLLIHLHLIETFSQPEGQCFRILGCLQQYFGCQKIFDFYGKMDKFIIVFMGDVWYVSFNLILNENYLSNQCKLFRIISLCIINGFTIYLPSSKTYIAILLDKLIFVNCILRDK